MPPRAEAVGLADDWALAAARHSGSDAATLAFEAGRLRERLWRLEGKQADGLEALELYESAARADPARSCTFAVRQALLRGELESNPEAVYRALYVALKKAKVGACARQIDGVLATLSAFQPLPTVLAELERGVTQGTGESAPAPPANAEFDQRGSVVVPTLEARHQPSVPVRITAVERYGAQESARIVVLITRPTTFQVGFLERTGETGPRLYVDIAGATYKGPLEFDVGGLVQRVRLGRRKSGTRVVLDLEQSAYRKVFYLPEPFRLVIDVATTPPSRDVDEPKQGPRTVERVVLDPGHGGEDPGATGPRGLMEKDVTLDIAHRAAPLLARELEISTLLTRDADQYVALDERTARANAFRADLFVSIHCNATEDGKARGVSTYVLDASPDTRAAEIAARENAASAAAAAELAAVMSQVLDEGAVARSVHFAELLQRATMASLAPDYAGVPDLGVRRAGFYVLAGAHMPAVLFEVSFISDSRDEMRLNTGDYRQKLADAIVNAIRAYRDGL